MDKKLKTKSVKMTITGRTSDIGDFIKGEVLKLPPHIAKAAVEAGIAEDVKTTNNPAPKKGAGTEVTRHG